MVSTEEKKPIFPHTFADSRSFSYLAYQRTHTHTPDERMNWPVTHLSGAVMPLAQVSGYHMTTSECALQKRVFGADRSPTVFCDRRTYASGQRRSPYSRRHRHVSVVMNGRVFASFSFFFFFLLPFILIIRSSNTPPL